MLSAGSLALMTDRIIAFTVVLNEATRDDDSEAIAKAIGMIKGVRTVTPVVQDVHKLFAYEKIRSELGYEPRVTFEDGMADLVNWVRQQRAPDHFDASRSELAARGLTR